MEAFSDGVIAIIITVMVLELRQPPGVTYSSLRSVYPDLLAYALSFLYLGTYWNNHHHLLSTVRKVNGRMLWANLNLLFWLSLFPFFTRWMATDGFASQTISAYGVVLLLAGFAYFLLQSSIVASQRPDTGLRDVLGRDFKGWLSLVGYSASIPLALVWRWGALSIIVGVGLMWLIPDPRLAHYLDHHSPGA